MGSLFSLDIYRRARGILLVRWLLTLTAGGHTRAEVGAVSVSAGGPRIRGLDPRGDAHAPIPTLP